MVLPPITKQQENILLLLYRFRFLNRLQIQTLLNHKTFNRINAWLKDLTEKNYIKRILPVESAINNLPAKYYLSLNGIRYLKTRPECEQKYLLKIYKEADRSEAFINQSQFIADIYIYLSKKYKEKLNFYTQAEYSLNGLIKELFPLFVFRKNEKEPYYVVEIFREKMPKERALIPRIQEYIKFFTQGSWTKQELPPKILFICPDNKMREKVYKVANEILDDEDISNLSFYITTRDQIRRYDIEGEIWERIVLNE